MATLDPSPPTGCRYGRIPIGEEEKHAIDMRRYPWVEYCLPDIDLILGGTHLREITIDRKPYLLRAGPDHDSAYEVRSLITVKSVGRLGGVSVKEAICLIFVNDDGTEFAGKVLGDFHPFPASNSDQRNFGTSPLSNIHLATYEQVVAGALHNLGNTE